jgi:hypothetical protein
MRIDELRYLLFASMCDVMNELEGKGGHLRKAHAVVVAGKADPKDKGRAEFGVGWCPMGLCVSLSLCLSVSLSLSLSIWVYIYILYIQTCVRTYPHTYIT